MVNDRSTRRPKVCRPAELSDEQTARSGWPAEHAAAEPGDAFRGAGRGTRAGAGLRQPGCLHDEQGRIRRRYAGRRWIACRLEFRGWHRGPLLSPGGSPSCSSSTRRRRSRPATGLCPLPVGRLSPLRRPVEVAPSGRGQGRRDRPPAARRAAGRHPARDRGPTRRRTRTCPTARWSCSIAKRGWSSALSSSDGASRATPTGVAPRDIAEVLTPPSLIGMLATGWSGEVPPIHPSALES